ncbi:hypothetical protein [Bradyrhizobium altum]|uniref:hypothetical protein n=1 Tax=Bradyrhizobium altum TaxID=1571202 RepID=UPI0028966DA3|nr:hypothetical protein [Bradyrhizobium altum]
MMVDRCAESFKVATRTTLVAAVLGVSRTGVRVDCRHLLAAPKIIEPVDPRFNFKLITWPPSVGQVDRQHVGAIDVVDVAPMTLGLILLRDVVC